MTTQNINSTPIYFSQTREDSDVELRQILDIDAPKIFLIASAGDTIANLLVGKKDIKEITAVDLSKDQLALASLKLALIQKYDGNTNHIILSNSKKYDIAFYKEMISDLILEKDISDYWMENVDLLIRGVNQCGRFEQLFKLAAKDGFDNHFSHENLTKIFGDNATKYSMKKCFSQHFQSVLETYIEKYSRPTENYFYHQFINNSYLGDLPPYLQTIDAIKLKDTIVEFKQTSVMDYFSKNDCKFDLINLSNITDWLDPITFCKLLDLTASHLNLGGKIVLRRLNSDTSLRYYLENNYLIDNRYKFDIIDVFDKSHFYSEILILKLL